MPDYTQYPAGSDLLAFLTPVAAALHVTLPPQGQGGIDYQQRIESARGKFEGQIGRGLLATPGQRRFDPPTNRRGILDLGADLVSVASLSVAGAAMVQDTDYFLEPFNADQEGKPFRRIEFVVPRWYVYGALPTNLRRTVVITGLWGYSALLPPLAWDAILAQGAIDCYEELALLVSRGLQMRKEGDVEEMYARGQGNGPLLEEMKGWQLRVVDGINNFTLVEVGL